MNSLLWQGFFRSANVVASRWRGPTTSFVTPSGLNVQGKDFLFRICGEGLTNLRNYEQERTISDLKCKLTQRGASQSNFILSCLKSHHRLSRPFS